MSGSTLRTRVRSCRRDRVTVGALVAFVSFVAFSAPASSATAQSQRVARALDANHRGVLERSAGAQPGYTLLAPLQSRETYLIDLDGRIVHRWRSDYLPGQSATLLDDGHLLRAAREDGLSPIGCGGAGGRIEEFDWDGNLVWTWCCNDERRRQHHEFEVLPDGNVVVLVWELKSVDEAIEAGRDPATAMVGVVDSVLEVAPTRPFGGTVVWEWHVWDHLIQDREPGLPNFGVVADEPGRLDLNALADDGGGRPGLTEEEQGELRRLGYLGSSSDDAHPAGGRIEGPIGDWNHVNSVDYHAGLDQLLLSSHNQHEVWIIDHGTTTEEAAGSSGGRRGRGGDFLWRWGNPRAWKAGDASDQQLFGQHDARWIADGRSVDECVLLFNNLVPVGGRSGHAPARLASCVVSLELPLLPDGTYFREQGRPFGPCEPAWRYGGAQGEASFFSPVVSGAQRLPNGNTLISSGAEGRCIEIDAQGRVVWSFRNPYGAPSGEASPRDADESEAFGAFFRAKRLPPDHPAFRGRQLDPR